MLQNYIGGSDAVILCYDVTNKESFQDLEDWYRLVKKGFSGKGKDGKASAAVPSSLAFDGEVEKKPLIALMGNKIHLKHMRQVSMREATNFCEENSFGANYQVSARSGDSVNLSFLKLAQELNGGRTLTKMESRRCRTIREGTERWR
jgi:Ras-related protein Rab-28